jgi:hypothetical protein
LDSESEVHFGELTYGKTVTFIVEDGIYFDKLKKTFVKPRLDCTETRVSVDIGRMNNDGSFENYYTVYITTCGYSVKHSGAQ